MLHLPSGFPMSQASSTTATRQSLLLVSLGRGFGGALIFSLPMLMTMEMWELGFSMDRWRLLALLVVSMPLMMFLSRYSGFESTRRWDEDLRDVAIAYGIGTVTSGLVLLVTAVIGPGMGAPEIVGKLCLHTFPAALGALLGRSQFGRHSTDADAEESYPAELGIMAIGALFLGLNVAPTEEMVLISYRMTAWHSLVLVPLSIAVMHGFVFASEFKGGTELSRDTPWWSALLRFTVVGYVVALAISAYALWTFGRFDGLSMQRALQITVVLGFPAAIGAAAARLIL